MGPGKKVRKRPASDPHRFLELESMDVEKWFDLLCLFSFLFAWAAEGSATTEIIAFSGTEGF